MANALNANDLKRLAELMDNLNNANLDRKESDIIKDKLKAFFKATGLKSYRYGDMVIRFVDDYESRSFDLDMLRERYPAIFDECHSTIIKPCILSIAKRPLKRKKNEEDIENA